MWPRKARWPAARMGERRNHELSGRARTPGQFSPHPKSPPPSPLVYETELLFLCRPGAFFWRVGWPALSVRCARRGGAGGVRYTFFANFVVGCRASSRVCLTSLIRALSQGKKKKNPPQTPDAEAEDSKSNVILGGRRVDGVGVPRGAGCQPASQGGWGLQVAIAYCPRHIQLSRTRHTRLPFLKFAWRGTLKSA